MSDSVVSPCCKAKVEYRCISGAESCTVFNTPLLLHIGRCGQCRKDISRWNPRVHRFEWLDGEQFYSEKILRVMKEWYTPVELLQHKIVIGLIGMQGSGKGTFSRLLKEFGARNSYGVVEVFSSGGILAQLLDATGTPKTRANMQNMAIMVRKLFGDVITEAMRKKIDASDATVVVFDGVRWASDVKMITSFPRHMLVSITADRWTRYERLKLRKEKAGEEMTSEEQFIEEENAETEVEIPVIAQMASMEISNEVTPEEFEHEVNRRCCLYLRFGGFVG